MLKKKSCPPRQSGCACGRSTIRKVEKGIAAVQDVRGRALQLLEALANVLFPKGPSLATPAPLTSNCQQDSQSKMSITSLSSMQHLGAGSVEAHQQDQMQQDIDAGLKQNLAQVQEDIVRTLQPRRHRRTYFHNPPCTTAVQAQQQSVSALLSFLQRYYAHHSSYQKLLSMAQQNPRDCCGSIMEDLQGLTQLRRIA